MKTKQIAFLLILLVSFGLFGQNDLPLQLSDTKLNHCVPWLMEICKQNWNEN